MREKETGRRILGELFGSEYLERADRARNSFNSILEDFSEEVCFGRVWARGGIDRKQRSIINIAMLTALNRLAPLRTHLNGALNNGCTIEEIQEILLQSAVYCGLPAATDAFRVADEVLKARGIIE